MAFDVHQIRRDFPMLQKKMHGQPLVYLDSAATAHKPNSVIEAIQNFYQDQYATVHRAVYELAVEATALYQETRLKVQKLIHAKHAEEIIFTRGATDSINLVAYSFGKAFIQPGDEILISEIEHHANIVPWQILCEDRGARLKIIPVNERGEVSLKEYAALLNPKTKLVAIAQIANSTGTIHPIKEIIEMAHNVGAKVLVDGAQSVPHLSVDVQALEADFLVFSGHKMYGPTGIGILYGKKELLEVMPPYQGGGDMIDKVTLEKTTYNALPLKFEAGTPMIAEVIGLGAAIDYVQKIGLERIANWEQELTDYAMEKMQTIQALKFIGHPAQRGAIITFVIEGIHPLDLGTMLNLRGIALRTGHHCSQPAMKRFGVTEAARISFAFYNTKEEIDYFIKSLKDVMKLFL